MIRMKGSTARMFLTVLFAGSISVSASAEDWEAKIVASTTDGAENSIYFGQKPDATDGYDSKYEVRAMLSGNVMAYFPHAQWDVMGVNYWRDIKAPGQTQSWIFEVTTAFSGTEVMLKWDPLKLPEGYAVELTDIALQTVIDMTSHNGYYFNALSEPSQFTISTKAPDMAVFLKSPTGLEGAWSEDKTGIHLVWTDNSEGESGFIVERKQSGEPWAEVAWLEANTTSYSDYNLPDPSAKKKNNNAIFLYRLKAYNSLTESDFSNTKPIK